MLLSQLGRGREGADPWARHAGALSWEWPQNPAAPAGCGGTRSRAESGDEGSRGSGHGGSRPMGCARTGQSQRMLGFSSWGGRKIVHIIFCRLRAKSQSFYLQKLFQAIDLSSTTHTGKGNKNLAS